MSKALTLVGGDETIETVRFTSMMDKFFDTLNVMNFTNGKMKRKPFRDPYCSVNDFRITVINKFPYKHYIIYCN